MAIARRVVRNGDTGLGSGVTSFSEVTPEMARWPSAKESLRYWTISALVFSAAGPLAFSSMELASIVSPMSGAKIKVIGEADVFHLFSESTYAFKLAIGRREGILVFGHSFSSGNDFLLDNTIEHVEDRSDGGRLLLGR